MAKFSNKDIFEGNFLKEAQERANALLDIFKKLREAIKDVGSESEKSLKDLNINDSVKDTIALEKQIKKLTEQVEDLKKVEQGENKVKEENIKLSQQQTKLEKEKADLSVKNLKIKQEEQKALLAESRLVSQNLKNEIAVRKEKERQAKERDKQLKQQGKTLSLYQKESKRLTDLRNKYKNLAIAEKENTQEGKALLREITKLDKKLKDLDETVGQNQRSVGDYKKAVEGLKDTVKTGFSAGPLLAIGAVLGAIGTAFGDTREGALQLQILLSKITESAKVLVQSIIKSADSLPLFWQGIVQGFDRVIIKAKITGKTIQETFTFGDASKKLKEEIAELEGQLEELNKPLIKQGVDKIKDGFKGIGDTTSRAIEEQEKFLRLQLKTRISIERQERALAGLAEKRQILQDISDDDTIGFLTRAKAVKRAQDEALRFAQLENKLALTKEKLTIQAVKQDIRRANILSERQLQGITTGEQLNKLLKDQAIARKISDQNEEAFTQAFIERVNKQVEAEAFRRDQEEKNRKTARDAFGQELDILEEFTEKRVALNQKIISSDTASLEERQRALRDNQKLEEDLFKKSIDLIFKQAEASIDLRKDLTKQEKEAQKALLDRAKIQEILNAQTQEEQFLLIRSLDLGEIEEKRLKESLKIKQDIATANQEALKTEQETILKTQELKKDIAIQERKLAGEKIDLEKAQFENQKQDLQKRIDLLKEDSVKRLELEKELNELLLQEQAEAEAKATQKRADAIRSATELITNFLEKQSEERLQKIEENLSKIEDRNNSLRQSAEQGNEQAVKSLQESEKREAELRAEKEKELIRQQRIEAGLSAFKVFSANAEEDPKSALSKTISDVTVLTAFLANLPSFFTGTEDTGVVSGANALDANGGRLTVLHNNERVLTAEDNKKIGSMSNAELTQLAVQKQQGLFNNIENRRLDTPSFVINKQENLKEDIRELIREVRKNRPVNPVESFDKRTGMYKEVVNYGGVRQSNYTKLFKTANRK